MYFLGTVYHTIPIHTTITGRPKSHSMGCGSSSPSFHPTEKFPDDEDVQNALLKFAQFDTDHNGFIEARELAGLKKLFRVSEVDVGTRNGRVDRAEFLAFVFGCSQRVASDAVGRIMDRNALAKRLDKEVEDALAKFAKFDADNSGYIDGKEIDAIKKEFGLESGDLILTDGKMTRENFFAQLFDVSPKAASAAIARYTIKRDIGGKLSNVIKQFKHFDADGNGSIEEKELDGLKRMFSLQELDVGVKDGRIQLEEVCRRPCPRMLRSP